MTNPGNAVGTNGAYGGRTSVNAFNDVMASFNGRGVLSGWACVPKAGLTVSLGGKPQVRDVAVAEDNNDNKTTVNNISQQPIDVTLSPAPNLGQRIDVIVAYVNNPPQGTATEVDNPGACGLIPVAGEVVATNPLAPTEAQIRTAIGADGGVSSNAYYVILAQISVTEGMTDVTSTNITAGNAITVGRVDSELSLQSTRPVENKVVTENIYELKANIGEINTALTTLDTGNGVTTRRTK